jgi:hypothetical protein
LEPEVDTEGEEERDTSFELGFVTSKNKKLEYLN